MGWCKFRFDKSVELKSNFHDQIFCAVLDVHVRWNEKKCERKWEKSLSGNNFFFNGQKSKVLEREAEMEGGIERTKKPFLLKLSLSLSYYLSLSLHLSLSIPHTHAHSHFLSLSIYFLVAINFIVSHLFPKTFSF